MTSHDELLMHHTSTDCLALSTRMLFFCAKVMPFILGRLLSCFTFREKHQTENGQQRNETCVIKEGDVGRL